MTSLNLVSRSLTSRFLQAKRSVGLGRPFAVGFLLFGWLVLFSLQLSAAPSRFPERRQLVVGADFDYPPYSYLDEKGKPAGQDVEIIKKIAQMANLDLSFQFGPWKEVLNKLEGGEVDLVLSILYTNERSRKFAYSIPYSTDHYSIFVRKDSDITGVDDLQNRAMIILAGDAVFDEIVKPLGLEGPTTFTKTTPEAMQRLSDGESEYTIVSYSTGIQILLDAETQGQAIENLKVVGHPVLPILYRFGVHKEDAHLLQTINENIDRLKTSGELKKINQRWVHTRETGLVKEDLWRLALYILTPLLLVVFLLILWSRTLRREVRRKSRKLLEARNEAVRANQAKTQFFAYMGHEIRSPINALLGFTQILMHESQNLKLEPAYQGYLRSIQVCSENLSGLINNLLDLSKIEAGMVEVEEKPLNLKKQVQDIFSVHQLAALKKSQTFTLHYDPFLPEVVVTDEKLVYQIISNLVKNAITYTGEGKLVWLRVLKEGDEIQLVVEDEGRGIPEELQKDIFKPYRQDNQSRQDRFAGTGLGLSLVQENTKLLGGRIDLHSEPGQGTIIKVYLPLKRSA